MSAGSALMVRVSASLPIRSAQADPLVAHLLVVDARLIFGHRQLEPLGREPANRGQYGIGSYHAVALCCDQRNPGTQELLLRVEHVQGCALPNLCLFANAI